MKELSEEEEQWLEVFAKYNPFFEDLFSFFSKNKFLTEKQYESLEEELEKAEEEGKYILDKTDFSFLKEHAEENEDLRKILEIYEEDGFLDDSDFNSFFDIKLELNPDFKKREIFTSRSENGLQRKTSNESLNDRKSLSEEILAKDPISNDLIYILKLENNKWWVGKTTNLKSAIKRHEKGTGPPWTHIYKPLGVEEVIENGDLKEITLTRMREYGWENVRGYAWSQWNVKNPPKELRSVLKPWELKKKSRNVEYLVYVIKLKHNKWYIGKTTNIKKELKLHRQGLISSYTSVNKVLKVEELIVNGNFEKIISRYIKKYGEKNIQVENLKTENRRNTEEINNTKEEVITPDLEETTYVLELENDKWYIGSTSDLESDLKKHKLGKKTSWTKLYKIKSVEEKDLSESLGNVSIKYMKKFGWWNVRGYPFRSKGKKWPPEEIKDQFNSVNEKDSEKPVVYILRLENEKWYVGRTYNLARSLKFHKLGSPPWVDIHKFIDVTEIIEEGDLVEITLEYMRKYGWQNVRGAYWKSWDLKKPPRVLRKKLELQPISDENLSQNVFKNRVSKKLREIENELVYILRLENNKWWIGKTKNLNKKLSEIQRGKGSEWIRENKIISVEKVIEGGNLTFVTLDYIKEYGHENVRGTCWHDGAQAYIPKKIKELVSEQKKDKVKILKRKFVYR